MFNRYNLWLLIPDQNCWWMVQDAGRPLLELLESGNDRARKLAAAALADIGAADAEVRAWLAKVRSSLT
jgi:hypothetical protein